VVAVLPYDFWAFHPNTLTLFAGRQEFNAGPGEGLFNGVDRAHPRINLSLFQPCSYHYTPRYRGGG
jgi:hypothetical protein